MKKLLFQLLLLFTTTSFAQQSYTLSGYIRDSISGEELIGATISVQNSSIGTSSNEYGFFSITVPQGNYSFEYSYIGYIGKIESIALISNKKISISLAPEIKDIQEVTVLAQQSQVTSSCKQKSIMQMEKAPSIFGVPDIMKVMQLQPGIKTIGEGSSGMYVRGGNRDQNMILVDEASLYNVSHMYGYVSALNPSMLKDVKFYNSYIPAEYGGRISSILDTKMKDGNMNNHTSEFIISPLTINANFEGPIKKDTASYFIAGRKSVLDMFLNLIDKDFEVPLFYDFNGKLNYKINAKNRIFTSFYTGKDIFKGDDFVNNSQNFTSTVRWSHEMNPKLFLLTSYIFNDYFNNTDFINQSSQMFWKIGVQDNTLKSKLSWYPNQNNTFKCGVQIQYHSIIPGTNENELLSMPNMKVFENSLFVNHIVKINKKLSFDYGIRYTLYQNSGDYIWYTLNQKYEPITKNSESKFIWNTEHSIEPRCNIEYTLKQGQLSASYSRTSQAMQIISNNAYSYSSMENWVSVSPNIKPLFSDNLSLGYGISKKKYAGFIETYYRNIQNQIDYIDHAQLFANPIIETEIRSGKATAYGIELSLLKTVGKTKWSASYAYAKVMYTIAGITSVDTYRAPYDMPHDIKLQASYDFSNRLTCAALWLYTSGRPATLPRGYFISDGEEVPIYGERNMDSYPNNHRLDISVQYSFKPKKKCNQSIALSIFNVYHHTNPLDYEFLFSQNRVRVKTFSVSLPSITYKLTIK